MIRRALDLLSRSRKLWLVLLVLALLVVAAPGAQARLGGGESFGGGGGSHSSGGGGGGGGDLCGCLVEFVVQIWFEFCCQYPQIGIPVTIAAVVGVFVVANRQQAKPRTFEGGIVPRADLMGPAPPRTAAGAQIPYARIREIDANFSRPLFLDFAVLLYMRAQEAMGKRNLVPLRPYLSEDARASIMRGRREDTIAVEDICVGNAEITSIHTGPMLAIDVTFEASFQVRAQNGTTVAKYSRERWRFEKKTGVLSKPPETIATFGCPSCGNPGELRPDGTCPSCDEVVTDGRFHWTVSGVQVLERREPRREEITTGGGDEVGLDRRTIYDPRLAPERRAFAARYPGWNENAFVDLVRKKFRILQQAWTERRLELARPHESDALFQAHRYWIERYRKAGITNVLEDIQISNVELVKIDRDAFFESITVRIFASMKDWKKDAQGRQIAGDSRQTRRFSEYWTFVRRSGFEALEQPKSIAGCPSCGAPLDVSFAGICKHCDAKVTSGQFGWVLARIDQDEVYTGQ